MTAIGERSPLQRKVDLLPGVSSLSLLQFGPHATVVSSGMKTRMMMLLQGARVASHRIGSDGGLLLLIVVHASHVLIVRSDLGRVSRSRRKVVGAALLTLITKRIVLWRRSRVGRIDD
jgi:hypothetical protein